jgi:hypothetical protein
VDSNEKGFSWGCLFFLPESVSLLISNRCARIQETPSIITRYTVEIIVIKKYTPVVGFGGEARENVVAGALVRLEACNCDIREI